MTHFNSSDINWSVVMVIRVYSDGFVFDGRGYYISYGATHDVHKRINCWIRYLGGGFPKDITGSGVASVFWYD